MGTAATSDEKQWRFTWETLAHLPTLRLYLFRAAFPSSISALRAELHLPDSLLLVSFSSAADGEEHGEEFLIRVPVPRVLIDPGSPVDCRAHADHIEARLALVLPVDHPAVAALRSITSSSSPDGDGRQCEPPSASLSAPISPAEDLRHLSHGDIHLYCKNCSARLTKQPLRHFLELPSLNWREIADSWFGDDSCCASGGASEKLISRFVSSYNRSEGATLVDAGSLIVRKSLLEDYTHHKREKGHPEACNGAVSEETDITVENQQSFIDGDPKNLVECVDQNSKRESKEHEEKILIDPHNCCNGRSSTDLQDQDTDNGLSQRLEFMNDISLGGGFFVRACNFLKNMKWFEYSCSSCSSHIGLYRSKGSDAQEDVGWIRLFKCYISTGILVGKQDDIFRTHTVARIFVNMLLDGAEDDMSFRTIVRDMKTERPVLRVVLLSSNTWAFTGCCTSCSSDDSGVAELQRVVKVLFAECNSTSEAESKQVEDWSAKHRPEVVYMMEREIDEVLGCLHSAMFRFPSSCFSMHGMHLSSLPC